VKFYAIQHPTPKLSQRIHPAPSRIVQSALSRSARVMPVLAPVPPGCIGSQSCSTRSCAWLHSFGKGASRKSALGKGASGKGTTSVVPTRYRVFRASAPELGFRVWLHECGREAHPSGWKPPIPRLCGTTEVVPFPKTELAPSPGLNRYLPVERGAVQKPRAACASLLHLS